MVIHFRSYRVKTPERAHSSGTFDQGRVSLLPAIYGQQHNFGGDTLCYARPPVLAQKSPSPQEFAQEAAVSNDFELQAADLALKTFAQRNSERYQCTISACTI
ncbi:hypothetical protein LJR098_002384 [Rhizobium sp. LjRoot98]|uniref:hypothetical protein n=1 Tax=unclassified Rhizobium TaxID=2613769 RepID=UPI0012E3959A|nr:hypothetical protein [Rhizobium sp. Root1204]